MCALVTVPICNIPDNESSIDDSPSVAVDLYRSDQGRRSSLLFLFSSEPSVDALLRMSMIASSSGSGIDKLHVFSREPFAEVQLLRTMIASSSGSGIDRLNVTEAVERPYSDEGVGGLRANESSRDAKSPETSLPNSPRSRKSGLVVRLFSTPPHVFGISQNQQHQGHNARQGDTAETLEESKLHAIETEVLSLSRILKSLHPPETFPASPKSNQGLDTEEILQRAGVDGIALEAEMLNLSRMSESLQPLETFADPPISASPPVSPKSTQDRHFSQERDTEGTQRGIGVDGILRLSRMLNSAQSPEKLRGLPDTASSVEPVSSQSNLGRDPSQDRDTEETQQEVGSDSIALEAEVLNLSRQLKSLQPLETSPGFPTSASTVEPVFPESSQERDTDETQREIGLDGIALQTSALPVEPFSPALSEGRISSQDRETEETFPGFSISALPEGLDRPAFIQDREVDEIFPGFSKTFPGFPTTTSAVEDVSPVSSKGGDSSQDRDIEETPQGVRVDGSRAAEEQAGLRADTGLDRLPVKDRNDGFGSSGVLKSNLPPPKTIKSMRRMFSDSSRGSTPSSSIGSASELQVPTVDYGISHPPEPLGAPHPGSPLKWRPKSEEIHVMNKSQEPPDQKLGVERDPSFSYYSAGTPSGKALFQDAKKKPEAKELVEIEPNISEVVRRLKAAYLDVEENELLSILIPPGILALDVNAKDYSIALEYYGPPIDQDIPKVEPVRPSALRSLLRNSSDKVRRPVSKPKPTLPSDTGMPSSSSWPQSSIVSNLNPFPAGIQRYRDRNKRELPALTASSEWGDDAETSYASQDQDLSPGTVRSVLESNRMEVSVLKSLATDANSHRPGKSKWWSKSPHPRSQNTT